MLKQSYSDFLYLAGTHAHMHLDVSKFITADLSIYLSSICHNNQYTEQSPSRRNVSCLLYSHTHLPPELLPAQTLATTHLSFDP